MLGRRPPLQRDVTACRRTHQAQSSIDQRPAAAAPRPRRTPGAPLQVGVNSSGLRGSRAALDCWRAPLLQLHVCRTNNRPLCGASLTQHRGVAGVHHGPLDGPPKQLLRVLQKVLQRVDERGGASGASGGGLVGRRCGAVVALCQVAQNPSFPCSTPSHCPRTWSNGPSQPR